MFKLRQLGINIDAIGTDSEQSILNAINYIYPSAKHLICWRHFADNITFETNMDQRNSLRQLFLGRADFEGLVHSVDSSFDSNWQTAPF